MAVKPTILSYLISHCDKLHSNYSENVLHMDMNMDMAPAFLRHQSAAPVESAFTTGASDSAAARSKCVAASLSSAAERGPASQVPEIPLSTIARIVLALS